MNLILKRRTINEILIGAFVVTCVIFPADIFNIKKILFLSIFLFNATLIFNALFKKGNGFYTFYGFIFPTFLFLYSTLITSEIFSSFSRVFAAYMFVMVFVIKHYNIDFEKLLTKVIGYIVFITILLVSLDFMSIIDVNSGFFRNEIMYKYDIGLMGKSIEYPLYYKIFFKSSPLIVILLFKHFERGKYLLVLTAIAALIFSGTRANFIFPVFFLLVFYVFFTNNKSKVVKFSFVLLCISFVTVFFSNIINMFNELLIVKGEASNVIRMGHLKGIKELLQDKPFIIITGSGMGSEFYSYGLNAYVSSIEWSYIDLWRQMGFLPFMLFIIFISLPLFKNNLQKYKKFGYITYLFIAATNPLLFSSTSYLFFIYMYYDIK